MDYIREINAFYDHDLANHLSQSAGYTYLALLNVANRLYWKQRFSVSDAMLMARTGIKDRRTFRRAIKELAGCGLVVVEEDGHGAVYTVPGLSVSPPAKTQPRGKTVRDDMGLGITPPDIPTGGGNACLTGYRAGGAANGAGNITVFTGTAAEGATGIAENNAAFTGIAAPGATSFAGQDGHGASSDGTPRPVQTKLNQKEKLKQKETKQLTTGKSPGDEYVTGTAASPGGGGLVNNGQLIAELVHNYREVQGVSETRGDYAFIGALYNEYGYSQVLSGINDLALALAVEDIKKPLLYLKGILKRAGPEAGRQVRDSAYRGKSLPDRTGRVKAEKNNEEEDNPIERYQRERYRG